MISLKQTSKYSVFEFASYGEDAVVRHKNVVVVGGGRKPVLEDVVKVGRWKWTVELDNATLMKVQEAKPSADTSDAFALSSLQHMCIPQVHGPAIDAVQHAVKVLELELSSTEGCATGAVSYDCHAACTAVCTVLFALQRVGEMSLQRSSFLCATTALPPLPDPPTSNGISEKRLLWVVSAMKWMQQLGRVLQKELVAATTQLLRRQEEEKGGQATEDVREAEARRQAERDQDLEGLSEEKRVKIEAKRKAKAEKEAAKAAKKKQFKGAVALGVGNSELKRYVASLISAPAMDTQQAQVLDVLAYGDASAGLYCSKLLERLGSGGTRRLAKIPKGTRDYMPAQMRIREQALATIRRVFKRHGASEIDTPVFEMKETLTGKYGEDSKLIYDLADQGGELLSLRYDLTVPFARYLALNRVGNIKRYHIAKVYRRDNPVLSKGRYREFYQCDFDIAGAHTPLVPDAEVLTVACEILLELPIGPFQVKLNHRRLLDAIFDLCGVPEEKFRAICSAVDKLDKEPWESVRCEMIEKGLPTQVADRIGEFVTLKGEPFELHQRLIGQDAFQGHTEALAALQDLHTLFTFLEATDSLRYIIFDLSLARGLDYYTGVIYEAVVTDGVSTVGSVAAGGRYDRLVGMFSGQDTPCVGVSIGVERVFTLMEHRAQAADVLHAPNVEVLVASIGPALLTQRMRICKRLWEANISAEFMPQENPNLGKQLQFALEKRIPYMVIFGDTELEQNMVKVKDLNREAEVLVALQDVAQELVSRGCKQVPAGVDLDALERMR